MNTKTNECIGNYLRQLRINAGFTQKDVAEKLGVPQSTVSKLEIGVRSLRFYELFAYAEALGLNPDIMFADARRCLWGKKPSDPAPH
ncbi:MAG: helix-turn-helix transcriptional regulator [Atopobiaceae bacterium]|nr:helix-turn-helix transcriptional regulator [Atopobiaceae bacterium]